MTENEALETLLLRMADMHPQRSFLEKQLYRTDRRMRGEQRLKTRFKKFWIAEEFSIVWDVN